MQGRVYELNALLLRPMRTSENDRKITLRLVQAFNPCQQQINRDSFRPGYIKGWSIPFSTLKTVHTEFVSKSTFLRILFIVYYGYL